jgi:hypothetical protein
MNNANECAVPKTMSHQLAMASIVIRGFIAAAFLAIALLPVVLSATAATIA